MVNSYKIQADDKDITDVFKPFFKNLKITDNKGIDSDSFTLSLCDPNNEINEPENYKILTFFINGINKGTFEVNNISGDIHTNEMDISGTAITMQGGLKSRKSRTFEPLTIGALVDQVAKENGFATAINEKLAPIKLNHINQVKESDLNLLTRIANDNGATFKATQGKMAFIDRDEAVNLEGAKLPIMPISDPKKTAGRWTKESRDQIKSVSAEWFDEKTNKQMQEIAGEGSPSQQLQGRYKSKDEALNAAKSELKRLNKMDKTLSLTTPLTVEYIAGCDAIITNHSDVINGLWSVESMTHSIGLGGFDITSIELKKPQ